ncbi:Phospholipid-transporting ATPase 1 isoform B [Glycine soja]|uniref:Phospholipid-transporting ATPase n=1 Tax=Glycine soja TaxID=3848 RepID=A0A445HEZ1_GLYSO|nr:Phospholipid-transporting ATPase 1 isoform A [Glycine soja]RZB72180.1 Phospholipid-transporting ATPase 1 isoform B [Glycine soja]
MALRVIAILAVSTVLSFVGLQFFTDLSLDKLTSDRLIGWNLIHLDNASQDIELPLGLYTTIGLLVNCMINVFILLNLCLKGRVVSMVFVHDSIDPVNFFYQFNVLGMHEFDSDRKRMSVILGYPDNSVKVFVKGADTFMLKVIDRSFKMDLVRATEAHLHSYSSMGLRTLVIGMRDLNASEFEQWHASFEAASTAVFGRAAMLRKVSSIVENSLAILGASSIEDKLQQGVPESIESLRIAGIKVWVLTGDKQETAISIGYYSKLLTSNMTQITINSKNRESCRKSLQDALVMSKKLMSTSGVANNAEGSSHATPVALIIDGTSLVHILDSELEEQLFQLASRSSVVLCCCVTPLQKAGIVALVKNRTSDMTLAIGDGANDVSMIQMPDVGIGISGQEGRQAVMASDFAMGQFRFSVPLLLIHSHWNYQRLGYMILYNFYRNAVVVLVLFWAFFDAAGTGLFWLLLLGIIVTALLPHLVVKFVYQYYFPDDIQICREAEKIAYDRVVESGQVEMLRISDNPSR